MFKVESVFVGTRRKTLSVVDGRLDGPVVGAPLSRGPETRLLVPPGPPSEVLLHSLSRPHPSTVPGGTESQNRGRCTGD